ncbi:hypothetical protein F4781DRAFT_194844 [Annulohypoxylon bovei var. microspora]|nr:hypothetical protein F4781DRAFT_194844 [Annulohypoxylon bovei var. microspora]
MMFSVEFSSKRFYVQTLLWGRLLFKSRCDDAWTDEGTTELGVMGAPDIEVDIVTVTTTIAYNPNSGVDGGTTVANDGTNQNGNGNGNGDSSKTEQPTPVSSDTMILLPQSITASQASSHVSKTTTRASTSSSSSSPSTSPSNTPGTLSSSAIGAITGSISGAILLSALIFLFFRAYKRRKQRQEAHKSIELDKEPEGKRWNARRLIPSAIDTTGFRRPRDFDENDRHSIRHAHGHRNEQGGHDTGIGVATDGTDLAPTTPALESGRRPHAGLHSRRISTASPSDRDSLYYKLLHEVKAGPARDSQPPNAAAASSAVEWRDPATPSTPAAGSFNFDFNRKQSGSGLFVTNPTPAARPESTLGDRAWHRRKLSTTFQPPPSGPPSMPLPPTPPARSQRSIDTVLSSSMPASTSKPTRQSGGNRGGEKKADTNPTESTEALLLPQSFYALRESVNISTQALGPSPAPTPPPKDDLLTLPSTRYERPKDEGKGKGKEKETASPTLPPISQGGYLDVGPWSSMMHAVEAGDRDVVTKEKKKGQEQEEQETMRRPESSSTIGTSILFPSEDES